jgi:hypothetical protein
MIDRKKAQELADSASKLLSGVPVSMATTGGQQWLTDACGVLRQVVIALALTEGHDNAQDAAPVSPPTRNDESELPPPPSQWTDEQIADRLDLAIKSMREPASQDELPQYRATIRVMRRAEQTLRGPRRTQGRRQVSALRAVLTLAGENAEVRKIVSEAIAEHGGPDVV